jgi:hypothetical protein
LFVCPGSQIFAFKFEHANKIVDDGEDDGDDGQCSHRPCSHRMLSHDRPRNHSGHRHQSSRTGQQRRLGSHTSCRNTTCNTHCMRHPHLQLWYRRRPQYPRQARLCHPILHRLWLRHRVHDTGIVVSNASAIGSSIGPSSVNGFVVGSFIDLEVDSST